MALDGSPLSEPIRRKYEATMKPDLAVISLFCGAGGLDLGFGEAGYQTVYAADAMRAAVDSFNLNLGPSIAEVVDLQFVSPKKFVDEVERRSRILGVVPHGVIGGPPCQGVSNANTASGPSDPRNVLFDKYVRVLREADRRFSLDFFVLENVPGLRAEKNRSLYEGLKRKLERTFIVTEAVLDASHFGVAQSRKRLFMVGINRRLSEGNFCFPQPTSLNAAPTVRDKIEGLIAPCYLVRGLGQRAGGSFHPNHWTMRPISEKFGSIRVQSNVRSFLRLSWDKPSRTVAYGNREIHIHPDGLRRLSIFEAMRLQGFPDHFQLMGNFSEQVTQVSNAVPPPVAKAVANAISKLLYEKI